MTIIAGFSGFGGTVLCADSQETVSGYAKRDVWKIRDREIGEPPFHVAFAGSGSGPYLDMLTEEMQAALNPLEKSPLSLSAMQAALSKTLIDFYKQHIWPRGAEGAEASKTEFLAVIQPPKSEGFLFHIYETAINWIQDRKAIGVGSYLADVVLDNTLSFHGDELHLLTVAVNMLKDVRDNISDCGKDPHVYLYRKDGTYIWLYPNQIEAIEEILKDFKVFVTSEFYAVTDCRHQEREHSDLNLSGEKIVATIEEFRRQFGNILNLHGEFRNRDLA